MPMMPTQVDADAIVAAMPADLLIEFVGDGATVVADLTHDSRQVQPGWAFACVVGERADGHGYAPSAVDAGATLLLVERRLPLDVAQVVVVDVRRAMGHAAAVVHGFPARSLKLLGVTGTNGKTTTSQMLGAMLRSAGLSERTLGTLSGARTTPEASDLHRQLGRFVGDGVDAVVMEVSSHAMVFHRVAGVHFDVAVFTNLGRDHLDLHESMEAYFRAKASLFDPMLVEVGVTNVDDPYGQLLMDAATVEMTGFGRADATDVVVGVDHHEFTWRGHRVRVPIGGHFNVMNSLAALTAATRIGISDDAAIRGLAELGSVPGRFETVSDPNRDAMSVVVDYAHTPDGLEEVLLAARDIAAGGRVIAVFGCAGDRDVDKRAPMGAIGARLADLAVVTSDNPRTEDPDAIVATVVGGVGPDDLSKVHVEVDRRAAISFALQSARRGDVVVIAGKGHEAMQTIGTESRPFDDRSVARVLLDELATSPMTGES